ncbi:MAG: EthD family reductase [Anaerolineales bacterium]|nr:MAG: EthD family reductase [Anaerolineales bacterium]
MSALIALYKQPPDSEAFDQAYFGTHLPLISKVPGLRSTKISRFTRTLMGEGYYLMAEMDFGDKDTLKAAMRSPEMAAAGEILNSFAEGLVTLMFAEPQG